MRSNARICTIMYVIAAYLAPPVAPRPRDSDLNRIMAALNVSVLEFLQTVVKDGVPPKQPEILEALAKRLESEAFEAGHCLNALLLIVCCALHVR